MESTSLDDLLTRAELEERLQCSKRTLQRFVKAGMPMVAVGPVRMFSKHEVGRWLARQPTGEKAS
jgi:phage terminase Nu1 subunit (DNA packaging protein)